MLNQLLFEEVQICQQKGCLIKASNSAGECARWRDRRQVLLAYLIYVFQHFAFLEGARCSRIGWHWALKVHGGITCRLSGSCRSVLKGIFSWLYGHSKSEFVSAERCAWCLRVPHNSTAIKKPSMIGWALRCMTLLFFSSKLWYLGTLLIGVWEIKAKLLLIKPESISKTLLCILVHFLFQYRFLE